MTQKDMIEIEIQKLKAMLDQAISRGEMFGSVKKIYAELKALENLKTKAKLKQ